MNKGILENRILKIIDEIWTESNYNFDKRKAQIKLNNLFIEFEEVRIATLKELLKFLSEKYRESTYDLKSKNRRKELVRVRQIYCYLSKQMFKSTLRVTGKEINRDHATVLHSIRIIKRDIITNEFLRQNIEKLLNKIVIPQNKLKK